MTILSQSLTLQHGDYITGNTGINLLEIEVNDDIIQKFSIIQTVEIFICHSYSTSSWGRWIRK